MKRSKFVQVICMKTFSFHISVIFPSAIFFYRRMYIFKSLALPTAEFFHCLQIQIALQAIKVHPTRCVCTIAQCTVHCTVLLYALTNKRKILRKVMLNAKCTWKTFHWPYLFPLIRLKHVCCTFTAIFFCKFIVQCISLPNDGCFRNERSMN